MLDNEQCWLKDVCNHKDCHTFCMRHYKLNNLYEEALISSRQRIPMSLVVDADNTDLEEFKALKQIESGIVDFIKDGQNLYIHSTICGNGKTSWALKLIQKYFNSIWFSCELGCKALFINVPRFLLAIKENISERSEYVEHIKKNIFKADIVVWDDIGTKAITSFESEHLYSFIDSRINLGKSNIFTSNLSDEEMHQFLGDRLASRICNLSYNIKLNGGDKRSLVRSK